YAGYITPLAVKAAADPKQCTESGTPWQVLKFYVEQGFGDNLPVPTLKINTGAYDPILGRTYFEIAMEGRSQHRSQGEGRIEFHGDQFSGLNLVVSKVTKVEKETSSFDGIDTSLTGISKLFLNNSPMSTEIDSSFAEAQRSAKQALHDFDNETPAKIVPTLMKVTNALERLLVNPDVRLSYDASFVAYLQTRMFKEAIGKALGLQVDALADTETVVPGGDLMVSIKAFQPKSDMVKIGEITLTAPEGWTVTKTDPPKQNNMAYNSREVGAVGAVFNVTVAKDAKPTQPYWLEETRDGDLFYWPKTGAETLPFDRSQLIAHVKVNVNGNVIILDQSVHYRFADPSRGEIRRQVNVVPALSVTVDRDLLVVPVSDKPQTRRLVVSVTNNTNHEASGVIFLLNSGSVPDLKPRASGYRLTAKGEKVSIPFGISIPANAPGNSILRIMVGWKVGEAFATDQMITLAYPHIQTHRFYRLAETTVNVIDLKPTTGKIGYIMGSGDEVPEAIRQMGLTVTLLNGKDLASGDLSKYDTIVVGIRASETRPDFVANNQRLLEYVKNGGNMIVQYQRGNFAQSGLVPYPVNTTDTQKTTAGSIARVVDENATVTILQPDHPIFNFPNKIGDDDFKGWVQERNAYNFVTFDEKYTPLLESHDIGEQENKGGLVTTQIGKGNWTYCSYSFFRQLPAGVGGAYRLFGNLLSMSKAK
ncbi:MAG: hypothetical protein ABIP78_01770, partial [Pyrinomonadaceae bacterium]